jgi:hypothetical protein
MMSFATVKQRRLLSTFCLPKRDMIGLPAEATGLPPALGVPARQHLQHNSHFTLFLQACTKLPSGDGIYVHTAGFNNKLEPGGQCYGLTAESESSKHEIF